MATTDTFSSTTFNLRNLTMKKRLLGLLAGALCLLAPSMGQAISNYYPTFGRGITDSLATYSQSGSLPPTAGHVRYEDNFAGAKITRVGSNRHHYSKDEPWSKNETYLIDKVGSIFNGATYDSIKSVNSLISGGESRWSIVNDSSAFVISGNGSSSTRGTIREINFINGLTIRLLSLTLKAGKWYHSEGNFDRYGRFLVLDNAAMDITLNATPDSICIVDLVNWKCGPAYAVPDPPGIDGLVGGQRWVGNTQAHGGECTSPGTTDCDSTERKQIDNLGVASDTTLTAIAGGFRGLGYIKYGGKGEACRVFEFNTNPDSLNINFWHKMTVNGKPNSAYTDSLYLPRWWKGVASGSGWTGGPKMVASVFGDGWIMGAKHMDVVSNPANDHPVAVCNAKEINNELRKEAGTNADIIGTDLITGAYTYLVPAYTNFMHASARATGRRGWAYITTTPYVSSSLLTVQDNGDSPIITTLSEPENTGNSITGVNEIYAVPVDGSRRMQRLVHTFSEQTSSYNEESHGVPSRDGTRVVFASDNKVAGATPRMYVADLRPQAYAVTSNATMDTANANARWGDQVNIAAGTYTVAPHPANVNAHPSEFYRLVYSGSIPSASSVVVPSKGYGYGASGALPSRVTWRGLKFNNGHALYKSSYGAANYDSVANCVIINGDAGFYNINESGYTNCFIGDRASLTRFSQQSGFTGSSNANFLTGNNMVLRDSISAPAVGPYANGALFALGMATANTSGQYRVRNYSVSGNVINMVRLGMRSTDTEQRIYNGMSKDDALPFLNGARFKGLSGSTLSRNSFIVSDSSTGEQTNDAHSALLAFSMEEEADSNLFLRDTVSVSGNIAQINLGNTYSNARTTTSGFNTFRACYFKNTTPVFARWGRNGIELSIAARTVVDSCFIVLGDSSGTFTVNAVQGPTTFTNNLFYANHNNKGAFALNVGSVADGAGGKVTAVNNIFYIGVVDDAYIGNTRAATFIRPSRAAPSAYHDFNLYSGFTTASGFDAGFLSDYLVGSGNTTPTKVGNGYAPCGRGDECASKLGSPVWTDSTLDSLDPTPGAGSKAVGFGQFSADIGPVASSVDTERPAPTTLNIATDVVNCKLTLNWTTTGDDSLTGTAARYEIRRIVYNEVTVSYPPNIVFASPLSVAVPDIPAPLPSGRYQKMPVHLNTYSGQSYIFAIRSVDEAGNASAITAAYSYVVCSRGGSGAIEP